MADLDGSISETVERLRRTFEEIFDATGGLVIVRAPGRVNLIGDHTDYNDGFVLPTTIHRAAYAAVRARRDDDVLLYSVHYDEHLRYRLSKPPSTPTGSWGAYVTGVIEELRRRGLLRRGIEMLVDGDVPLGAGLSSSAALEMAVAYGLDVLFELGLAPADAARLGQTVEHRYAGVECGIMDQFVSRLGRSGSAMLLDCQSLGYEHVPMTLADDGLALVIADTGVQRALAASRYGERRAECRRAVAAVREANPQVRSLRDVSPEMLSERRGAMEEPVYHRAAHVLHENERVLHAAEALRKGAFDRFGELMNASHASLRDLFQVSCPELDTLVAAAQATAGVLGARMTGGGFGGCAVILAHDDAVDSLTHALGDAYARAHGRRPRIYVLDRNYQTETLARDAG